MRRSVASLLVLACAAAFACAAAPAGAVESIVATGYGKDRRGGDPRSVLLKLSARTLKRLEPGIAIPTPLPSGYDVSPDGRRAVLATESSPGHQRLTFVSLGSFKRRGVIDLPRHFDEVSGISYLREDRVLLITNPYGETVVRVLNPLTRELLDTRTAVAASGEGAAVGGRQVFVRQPPDQQASLAVLDADGRITADIPLPGLLVPSDGDLSGGDPSLAVDPRTGHALVLGQLRPRLYDVDPAAGQATPHDFPAPVAGILAQKWIDGALDPGRFAIESYDRASKHQVIVPVDRASLIPGKAIPVAGNNGFFGAGDLALAPSGSLSDSHLKGIRAVRLDGSPVWKAEPGHRVVVGKRFGRYVYIDEQGVGSVILSARTGKRIKRACGPPGGLTLLVPDAGHPGGTDSSTFGGLC